MAHRSVPATRGNTTPSPGDLYVTAARQDHEAHCTRCRDLTAALDAAATANAESIARRDRIQLGLRLTARTAVTA